MKNGKLEGMAPDHFGNWSDDNGSEDPWAYDDCDLRKAYDEGMPDSKFLRHVAYMSSDHHRLKKEVPLSESEIEHFKPRDGLGRR